MYKNLITINLKEVARELKRKNVQFSYSRKDGLISIYPITIHISEIYIGIYQGSNKILFKVFKDDYFTLSNIIISLIKNNNNIDIECKGGRTSIYNIHILLRKDRIITMQNGRIL